MNIINLSSVERKATVELSADELVFICNALYFYQLEGSYFPEYVQRLYSDMMIVNNLTQYSEIGDAELASIVRFRNLGEKTFKE